MYIYSMSEGQVFPIFANAMAFINNLILGIYAKNK